MYRRPRTIANRAMPQRRLARLENLSTPIPAHGGGQTRAYLRARGFVRGTTTTFAPRKEGAERKDLFRAKSSEDTRLAEQGH